MNTAHRIVIALLLVAPASIAMAEEKADALDGCVTLGDQHKIVRNGGGQSFFVQDGESHYRVAFQGSCSSLSFSPRISIQTEGQEGRLCPTGTKVLTQRDICKVGSVSYVSAEEFEKARKRSR